MNAILQVEQLFDRDDIFIHDDLSLSPEFQERCKELFWRAVDEKVAELLLLEKARKPKNWFSKSENRVRRIVHERALVNATPEQRLMARRAAAIGRVR